MAWTAVGSVGHALSYYHEIGVLCIFQRQLQPALLFLYKKVWTSKTFGITTPQQYSVTALRCSTFRRISKISNTRQISPEFLVRRSSKFITRIQTLGRIDSSQKNWKIPLR